MLDAFRSELLGTQEALQKQEFVTQKTITETFENEKREKALLKATKPMNTNVSSRFEQIETALQDSMQA